MCVLCKRASRELFYGKGFTRHIVACHLLLIAATVMGYLLVACRLSPAARCIIAAADQSDLKAAARPTSLVDRSNWAAVKSQVEAKDPEWYVSYVGGDLTRLMRICRMIHIDEQVPALPPCHCVVLFISFGPPPILLVCRRLSIWRPS